ncbi:MAG TPA: alpha/beta family hydrolase [Longimicrobiales bacterium]
MERAIQLTVGEHAGTVDALLQTPADPRLLYVFAHGAGAGMRHSFMDQMSASLQELNAAVLRYQFPYMQNRRGRPDVPAVLEATVRAAIRLGHELLPAVPLVAGGKSMGGRMTSQLLAKERDLPVKGIAFVGFPLHQPGKPSRTRAAHLFDVVHPMLFVQGTRDTLADITLIREVTSELGSKAVLHVIEGADHSFGVLKKSGRTAADVQQEIARVIVEFGV